MGRTPSDKLEYLGGLKKLSATEFEYMSVIWTHPEGISSEILYEQFKQAQGTKSTILYNISEKGYVKNIQKGRHHLYFATVSQLDYEQAVIKQQLKKALGQDSIVSLIASFCGKKKLSTEQYTKVEDFLKELENDVAD